MNDQEIFDKVAIHLMEQGRPAMEDATCLYRGPNKTQCAFGALIPDRAYSPKMENRPAGEVIQQYAKLKQFLPHMYLIGSLQLVHDNWALMDGAPFKMSNLLRRLREVAKWHGLSDAVLPEKITPDVRP